MGTSDYYWSRNLVKGFGKMWFPLVLREIGDSGDDLLGSVVEELGTTFFFFGSNYPAPYHMTTPGLILKTLESKKDDLGIAGDPVITEELAAPARTLKTTQKSSVKGEIGPFPSLPAAAALDIDYSRMASVSISFGNDTRVKYIPTDYLGRLYKNLDGDADKIDPAAAISIDKELIVDQVLLARNFSVNFTSASSLSTSFEAKLAQANHAAEGSVVFAKTGDASVVANIQNGPEYLVAFKVIDWDDLG